MRVNGWCVPWPSSLKVSSRFSLSFSFFPRLRFLPPYTNTHISMCHSHLRLFRLLMTYLSLVLRHVERLSFSQRRCARAASLPEGGLKVARSVSSVCAWWKNGERRAESRFIIQPADDTRAVGCEKRWRGANFWPISVHYLLHSPSLTARAFTTASFACDPSSPPTAGPCQRQSKFPKPLNMS